MKWDALIRLPHPPERREQPVPGILHRHWSGSALARFLELRGRRMINACGATWYMGSSRFLVSVPYEQLLDPDPLELRRMIRETGAFGARFPSANWSGLESGLYVLRAQEYGIETVDEECRAFIERGSEGCVIRPATKEQLLTQGWGLNVSHMARNGRYDREFCNRRRWETFVEAAFTCSEVSFPAAFRGSRMAAYMVTCREHRWQHILHHISRHEDLASFANHALTFEVTRNALRDPDIEAVAYGYVPLCSAGGLHEYKRQFGYQVLPHRSAIQLHPALDAVLNSAVARGVVHAARSLRRNYPKLETLEAVLRGAHFTAPARLAPKPC
jgi:hypothetical protein